MTEAEQTKRITLISQALTLAALIGIMYLGLLSALLGGLLVYNLVIFGSRGLGKFGVIPLAAKIILLSLISLIVIALLAAGGLRFAAFINDGPESIVSLIRRMADITVNGRNSLPAWVHQYLPSNLNDWQSQAHAWLLENARYLSAIGRDASMFLVHLVFGMIIGGLVAFQAKLTPARRNGAPLAQALTERTAFLGLAFRRIVFSQIRISALNTCLTGIFLAIFMPSLGYDLPLIKTMIAVTFIVGLLPIIGNIISNTIIFMIALGVSLGAAVCALVFLILIHKLEYFVNARIIGTQIRSHAWEILLALLVMDAAFGISGMVAAPIYYAYIKDELSAQKLI